MVVIVVFLALSLSLYSLSKDLKPIGGLLGPLGVLGFEGSPVGGLPSTS